MPVVLTVSEVKALLSHLASAHYLMGALLYGSGLRRIELVRLRIKDIDFDYRQIRVGYGKRGKHRIVTLAEELLPLLQEQMTQVALYHQKDLRNPAYAGVWLPDALGRSNWVMRT